MKTKFTKSLLLAAMLSTGLATANDCPLCSPAYHGNLAEIRSLLNNGADVNATSEHGSALFGAVLAGHVDVVRELSAAGAKVNVTKGNLTPLLLATMEGHIEMVSVLLDAGAGPNTTSKKGLTALMAATHKGYVTVVKLLLANGANLDLVDVFGNTAWDYIEGNKRMEAVFNKALEEREEN